VAAHKDVLLHFATSHSDSECVGGLPVYEAHGYRSTIQDSQLHDISCKLL
jgi:hypothetical protein